MKNLKIKFGKDGSLRPLPPKDGSLRPLPIRKFIDEMTNKEISDEKLYSSRYQEKTLNDILKVNKSILLWIQIFGFSALTKSKNPFFIAALIPFTFQETNFINIVRKYFIIKFSK